MNVKSVENVLNVEVVENEIVKEDGGLKVALNTNITPELKEEGLVRVAEWLGRLYLIYSIQRK